MVKATAFVLVVVICLVLMTNVLVDVDDEGGYQIIKSFYEEPANTLDGVYIGSSSCFTYWNSLLSWKEYGICVYPFAFNSNIFYATEYLIKEARKTQPDAVYIVNINTVNDGKVTLQHMYNIIGCMPFSVNKLKLIRHLADIGEFSFADRLELYLPIIRYHSRSAGAFVQDLFRHLNGYKGSTTFGPYLKKIVDVSGDYITTDKKRKMSDKLLSSTKSLLDYCEKENVKVIFVTVPQARGKEIEIKRYNALNAYIEKRGFPVLNLMESMEEIGLDMKTDFYNGRHTNIHGSAKYTYYLSEYLIEHYGFSDKRQNADYKNWYESYDRYSEAIAPYILDFETDQGVRDYSLKAPALSVEKGDGTAVLSWDQTEGADGYLVYFKAGSPKPWQCVAEKTDNTYIFDLPPEGTSHFYTVVPYKEKDGIRLYGNFRYKGIQVKTPEKKSA